eukprot:SAG31_NODE_919_length_11010_cov_27.449821_10_plen_203_part_00
MGFDGAKVSLDESRKRRFARICGVICSSVAYIVTCTGREVGASLFLQFCLSLSEPSCPALTKRHTCAPLSRNGTTHSECQYIVQYTECQNIVQYTECQYIVQCTECQYIVQWSENLLGFFTCAPASPILGASDSQNASRNLILMLPSLPAKAGGQNQFSSIAACRVPTALSTNPALRSSLQKSTNCSIVLVCQDNTTGGSWA